MKEVNKITTEDIIKGFLEHLREHEYAICYYDKWRKNPRDESTKGYYPIADENAERLAKNFATQLAKRQKK